MQQSHSECGKGTESHAHWQRSSLHLESNNLTHAGAGRHRFVLVNTGLDALEVPVPMHRPDAELTYHCSCEKQPKGSSFPQATGVFAWAKQSFVEEK